MASDFESVLLAGLLRARMSAACFRVASRGLSQRFELDWLRSGGFQLLSGSVENSRERGELISSCLGDSLLRAIVISRGSR